MNKKLISFPELLPASRSQDLAGLLYLDPGLSDSLQDDQRYAPTALPMDRAEAGNWLAQVTGYAEMFKNSGDLTALCAQDRKDRYGDSASAIMSELLAMSGGGAQKAKDEPRDETIARAQGVLLLAWQREVGLNEIASLDVGMESSWQTLDESLGLGAQDRAELAGMEGDAYTSELDVSLYGTAREWLPVLDAVLRLTPDDSALFVDCAAVAEHWLELGLSFQGLEDASLLPQGAQGSYAVGNYTGFELLGRSAKEDTPWLATPRQVIVRLARAQD